MTIHSEGPRDPLRPANRTGKSGGTIVALAIIVLVAIGIGWYATSNRSTTTVNAPAFERSVPDTTTGQRGTNVTPGKNQNIPNPTPPRNPTPPAQ